MYFLFFKLLCVDEDKFVSILTEISCFDGGGGGKLPGPCLSLLRIACVLVDELDRYGFLLLWVIPGNHCLKPGYLGSRA